MSVQPLSSTWISCNTLLTSTSNQQIVWNQQIASKDGKLNFYLFEEADIRTFLLDGIQERPLQNRMAHIHFRSPLSRDSSASEKHTSGHLHLLLFLKQVDFKNITVQNADLKHGTSIKPSTWSNLFKPVCLNPFVGPSLTQALGYFCGTYILDVLVIILQVILPFLMLDCDILLKLGSINQQPWLEDQNNLGVLKVLGEDQNVLVYLWKCRFTPRYIALLFLCI